VIDKNTDFKLLFEKRIERMRNTLANYKPISLDDENLVDVITMGSQWDDPQALISAMNRQPVLYGQWALMLKELKAEQKKVTAKYNAWVSSAKEIISNSLYNKNIEGGMTANKAKPTNSDVDNKFNIYCYQEGHKFNISFIKYTNQLQKLDDNIATTEVVVEALKQRKDMLVSMGYIVQELMKPELYVKKKIEEQNKIRSVSAPKKITKK
jgi:hypothetical protein